MRASTTSSDRSFAHRRAEVVLTAVGVDGRPLAHTEVVVEQRRHAFGFGNIGFDFIPLANGDTTADPSDVEAFGGAALDGLERLADRWLELFNTATLPFYWGRFEPERGRPDTSRLLATAEWFRERGIALKGHPLLWHTVTAPWIRDLPVEEIERLQRDRIRREVGDFAGVIDTWDAVNEAVIMPLFDRETNGITRLAHALGRIPTIRLAFEEARAGNPAATLVLNDFDLSSAYECLIEGVLESGIRIDAIGLQTHMHQGYWGEDRMLAMVDRFARYGLPLQLTESTLLSGELMPPDIDDLNDYRVARWPSTPEGEARQAEEITRHYSSLVSHPAVSSITYWGITDDGAWLGAPVGLIRADGSPKPSYDALHALIKGDWWMPPTTLRTDDAGRVHMNGFLGEYRLSAGGSSSDFSVRDAGRSSIDVRVSA